jgi:fructuronate reductase
VTAALPVSNSLRLRAISSPAALPGVAQPAYDRDKVTVGVVHLGPGAFHRAHQAYYFDQLLARDPRWAICAVSLKSPGVRDALEPQDGLYTLAQLDEETTFRIIGSIVEVLVAPEDPPAVFARLAAPMTRMVTLTVTEKGYCLSSDGGWTRAIQTSSTTWQIRASRSARSATRRRSAPPLRGRSAALRRRRLR